MEKEGKGEGAWNEWDWSKFTGKDKDGKNTGKDGLKNWD